MAPSNKGLLPEYLERNGGRLGGDGFPGLLKWVRYQQSKLANLLFSYALHSKMEERGALVIKALTAHPGPTDTGLQGKTAAAGGTRLLDKFILSRTMNSAQSAEDGTTGIARCCCEPDVQSAAFYGPTGSGKGGPAELLPAERDAEAEALLWKASLDATGVVDFFGAQPRR